MMDIGKLPYPELRFLVVQSTQRDRGRRAIQPHRIGVLGYWIPGPRAVWAPRFLLEPQVAVPHPQRSRVLGDAERDPRVALVGRSSPL